MKFILISLLLSVFYGCVAESREAKYKDCDGKYWVDPMHAEMLCLMKETTESLKDLQTKHTTLKNEYIEKSSTLNFQMNYYNIDCQKFVKSLNDNQLKLYSNLIDVEKAQNLPQIELNKRQFYKSLTEKNIQELNMISDQSQNININSENLKNIAKELDKVKEDLLEVSQKRDKIMQFSMNYNSANYLPSSYQSQDRTLNYIKEWEQSYRQRNVEYNNNYNMMQINNNLSNIANSLRNMQK